MAARGRLALLIIIVTITGQVAALGLPTAVAYVTASSRVPATQVLRLLAKTWIGLCIVAAAVAGTGAFLVAGSGEVWAEAPIAAVYVVSFMSFALMFGCLQGERRFTPVNSLRIVNTSFAAIVLFTLLGLVHHTSVTVVFGAFALSNVIACTLGGFLVMTGPSGPPLKAGVTVRSLLGFGLAALPAANAPLETLSLDQAAVGAFLPREQLGLYVVAAAFDNFSSILVNAYGTIALPRITGERDAIAQRRAIRRTALGAAWIAGGATLFAEAIVGWLLPLAFGRSFAAAIPVARVLIIAGFLLSFRRILVVFLQAAGRPGKTAGGEVIGLVVLAITAAILIPILGAIGAAYALILAAVVADVYLFWMLHAYYRQRMP